MQTLRDDAALQAQVAFWQDALMPMASVLSAAPAPQVWHAIEARTAPRAAGSAAPPGWVERWFGLRPLAPLAAGLVLGITLTLLGPTLPGPQRDESTETADTQLPQSYVGVLAGANGRAGLIVSSRRHGSVMDVKQVQPLAIDAGRTLFLWALEADGSQRAIGPVPPGAFVQVALPASSELLFAKAAELAVSIEAKIGRAHV